MEKHTIMKSNFEAMVAQLEATPIHDPFVQRLIDESVDAYMQPDGDVDFEVEYLQHVVQSNYRIFFSDELFFETFAVAAAHICKALGIDEFRDRFWEHLQARGIIHELSNAEITALMYGDWRIKSETYSIGIHVASMQWEEPWIVELEMDCELNFRRLFLERYEYGDPDYIKELVKMIREKFLARDAKGELLYYGAAIFKRILDRVSPLLFYRCTGSAEYPGDGEYARFSTQLFYQF